MYSAHQNRCSELEEVYGVEKEQLVDSRSDFGIAWVPAAAWCS